jgi:hypothetical protein
MPEYIMEFDLDDTGKLINARRNEEIVRCRDCAFCSLDKQFMLHWCDGYTVKPDGYCNAGRRRE